MGSPLKGLAMGSFDVFNEISLNKLYNQQMSVTWDDRALSLMWLHCSDLVEEDIEVETVPSLTNQMGHVAWWPLLGLLSRYRIVLVKLLQFIEDRVSIDAFYGCTIVKSLSEKQWGTLPYMICSLLERQKSPVTQRRHMTA